MKILIVDDDLVDRQIVKRALQIDSASYELVEAETVEEGLDAYRRNNFDLVLIDYRMPGRDGVEMVKAIREGYKDKSAAVVMMSNSEEEQIALDSIRAGAQDFILKIEITASRLRRSILHAQTRFELENKLKKSYAKVKQLAERDTLTGLANRYLFDESLSISIANNRRKEQKLALLIIDLDDFKYVNDNFGHAVGDVLLQKIVQRVNTCLRGRELFARLGGDEFAIALSCLESEKEASKVAQRILQVFEKPFELTGRSLTSGASIGIAVHPENGATPEELFKNADIAMYRSKKRGKNQASFFESEMQEQFISRYEIEQQLRSAIDEEKFLLNYQAIYEAQTHQLGGFEVLLNWEDADGVHRPSEYLPIAEESKLILKIGRWVIENAVARLVKWQALAGVNYYLSINLSPFQFADRGLIGMLQEIFTRYGANPKCFIFEITEQSLCGRLNNVKDAIINLRALGCRVALDDFGTGASSIANLRDYPFDLIKIDQSFLPRHSSTRQEIEIFKSVVAMIKSLDLNTVVVGTETVEQVELCCKLGVTQLQGHFFARPECAEFIEENYLARLPSIK